MDNRSEQATAIATVNSDTLNNGLFYEIHSKPEQSQKIQLRLMINSGSLSETDVESGYAHLVEHMAFNGTKNFPKNKIIELFEKSGLTFGHDINANTNFSNTTYTLSIPKSDVKLLHDALLYLHDILSEVQFDAKEFDKEKGVVENEYRLREIKEKFYSDLLFNDFITDSQYERRLPIGTLKSIDDSTVASVKAFYQAWYRPNNAKLLVTGDIDSEKTAVLINNIFSSIKKSDNLTQQIMPSAPRLKTNSQSYSSKVINFSETDVYFDVPNIRIQNSKSLSQAIKQDMLDDLVNYRLNTINNQRVQPFIGVGFSFNRLLNDKVLKHIYIEHLQGQEQQAVTFIGQEIARINQYGFSQAEYDQQLTRIKSLATNLADRYSNKSSQEIADDVIDAWSKNNVEYTLQLEQEAYQMALNSASLKEVNQLAKDLFNNPSKLTLAIPYKSNKPDLATLDQLFADTVKKPISNIEVKVEQLTLPSITKNAMTSPIVKEKFYPEKQITQWTLSNGVDVIIEPDHSVKNSITMNFSAPGGTNSLTEKQLDASYFLINSYTKSDIAGISPQALEQKFINAQASIEPIILENEHGFKMYSVNRHDSLELLFSVLYSTFNHPKIKENAFALEKKRIIENQQTYLAQPTTITVQKLNEALFPNNKRQQDASIAQLQQVQKIDVERLYQTLFASVNGYKLTIVGDFKATELKPFILKYIANLATGKLHEFSDMKQSLIKQAKKINDTTNPQDNGLVLFYTVTDTPNKNIKEVYQAELMRRIIDQTLLKIVREKLSLTYSPSVWVESQPAGMTFTTVLIKVITKIEDVNKTQQVVNRIVNDFLDKGITEDQLIEHKNALNKDFAAVLKTSSGKEPLLHRDHLFGYTLGSTENRAAILDSISISDMNRFIKEYLDPQKTVQITNIPKK